MDVAKIKLYIEEGQKLVELGSATWHKLRELFASSGDANDQAALAKLDALYAARISQAKADAEG